MNEEGIEGESFPFDNFDLFRGMASKGIGCRISEGGWGKLMNYARVLFSWSSRINLISCSDRRVLATKHLGPALRLIPIIEGLPHRSLLDIGSGAGLPGIPIKIAMPEMMVYLIESQRRRVNFLREVVRRLDLKKIEVVHGRVEEWTGVKGGVDLMTARAFAAPEVLLPLCSNHLTPHGYAIVYLKKKANERVIHLARMKWEEQGVGTAVGVYMMQGVNINTN
jgi:16S rRNA (guanine527-N7)-methyltransferase